MKNAKFLSFEQLVLAFTALETDARPSFTVDIHVSSIAAVNFVFCVYCLQNSVDMGKLAQRSIYIVVSH